MEILSKEKETILSFSDKELQLVMEGLQAISIRGQERQHELRRRYDCSGNLIVEHEEIGKRITQAAILEDGLRVCFAQPAE